MSAFSSSRTEPPPVPGRTDPKSAARLVATIALMIGRLVLMGGVLTLASLEGALPLLIMALGVLVARFAVMNRVRRAAL